MTSRPRTIIAIGGGFSEGMFPDQDEFLLGAPHLPDRPRMCFVPTASGDAPSYIDRFYAAFGGKSLRLSHLDLFRRTDQSVEDLIGSQDIVYVGGGNTANLLAVWRAQGIVGPLAQAYAAGTVLAGISAGAACWFDACLTDSFGALAPMRDGLGLLRGSFCPHLDSEAGRLATFRSAVAQQRLPDGLGLPDDAAVAFRDGSPAIVHRSRPDAEVRRFTANGDAPLDLVEGWF